MNIPVKIAFLLLVSLLSCNVSNETKEAAKGNETADYSLSGLWSTDTLLTTCESVLYNEEKSCLYVSCIAGKPAEKDGTGFISLLDLNGNIVEREWISGLNAPKGMGMYKNLLYVTDIDELRVIDLEQRQINETIKVEGSAFLNDVAVDSNGDVYFSDSDKGIIFRYSGGKIENWISSGLDRPNGIYIEKDRILLTSSGSSDLKVIGKKTGVAEVVTRDIGHGDGIEYTGNTGYYLATSWAGEIFLIYPDFSKKTLLLTSPEGINSADIGFNRDEQIVYIPTFFGNRVVACRLVKQ